MVRDSPSWQLPPGATYDQLNMLNDVPGIARQRGGTTSLGSTATAFCTAIGFCQSEDGTLIEELYGLDGKSGNLFNINKTTGASTNVAAAATANSTIGRPTRHYGAVIFPSFPAAGSSIRQITVAAGQTSSTTFTSANIVTVSANQQQMTLTGTDVTTNIKVGGIAQFSDGINQTFYARVVSVDTTKKFTVWPKPTLTFNTVASAGTVVTPAFSPGGGGCCTSFQNRLLVGNTNDFLSTGRTLVTDRRIYYSPLPTESSTSSNTGATIYGATFFAPIFWPDLNWIEIPGADPIVAMEPISDGELVILTSTSVVVLTGNLVTELGATSPSVTFDVYPLGVTEGAAYDLSVQRTPVGIMWAGAEGVFAYWPPIRKAPAKTGIRNLCEGKILKYWLSLSGASDFAVHGAGYARNHYFISGFANGATFALMVNLDDNAWTRLSGAGTDIFGGVRRPTTPAQTYAARWWNQTGAAPSMTGGQIVRAESMLNQYTAGSANADSDGAAIPISLTTRTITGDAETQKLFQRGTIRYQQAATTAAVAVTAQSTIDAADIDASRTRALGSLSNTSTLTVTGATNANPIVITTSANHGLQSDDFVDVDAVGGNTNANGRYRIKVLSVTTFSLIAGVGNAAYTSGGKVKKMTESDFQLSALNAGQGASINISGSPVNFEMQAVEIAVLERSPVMSA